MTIKLKIVSILVRSKISSNMFPSTLKVVFDCASGKFFYLFLVFLLKFVFFLKR